MDAHGHPVLTRSRLQTTASTKHPVQFSPSLSRIHVSSSFAFGLHFYVMHLSLDKRDKRSFSDLISQWELFALEAAYINAN